MTDSELNLAAARMLGDVCDNDDCTGCDADFALHWIDDGRVQITQGGEPFDPATDIADAMRLVERFQKWELRRFHFIYGAIYGATVHAGEWMEADTPARALTLAAVRAAEAAFTGDVMKTYTAWLADCEDDKHEFLGHADPKDVAIEAADILSDEDIGVPVRIVVECDTGHRTEWELVSRIEWTAKRK